MFSTEVLEEKTSIYHSTTTFFLTGKKKSSNSSVDLKKLDVKWSLNSANFAGAGHVTSQISTQLPASKSPSVTGSADKK